MPARHAAISVQNTPGVKHWLDSVKAEASSVNNGHTYIYNPNTLSDYQGYMLGMSPEEIDRLFRFRAAGNILKTPAAFQGVTGITDSLLNLISPRLRFPVVEHIKSQPNKIKSRTANLPRQDINSAAASDFRLIKGIGPVLSERIVKFRNRLGGFQINEQLYDVYGLDRSVADRVLQHYSVMQRPELKPININTATAREIAELVYLNWETARQIIRYRERNGPFESIEELTKIEDFPSDKIDRINLYLSL